MGFFLYCTWPNECSVQLINFFKFENSLDQDQLASDETSW